MRVLYVSPYPPTHDGIGDYTYALANAVRNAGNDVGVIVPRRVSDAPPEVVGALAPAWSKPARLCRVLSQWNPDVIHVQFAVAAFGTRTLALMRLLDVVRRDLKVPVVVTLHEVTRESAELLGVGTVLFRWIAAHCDHLIVHTDIASKSLANSVGAESSITVIPHPVMPPDAATSSRDELRDRFGLGDARVLLTFGFIHVNKGLGDLIKALTILRRARPEALDGVRLVVAGAVRRRSGLFRAFEALDRLHFFQVLRQARRSSLADHLVRTGYVPTGEVAAWFGIADGVVLPYRRIEQSGVVSIAHALNVPVLASTAGGLAEQCAGSPWTFPPRAPEKIAETIDHFLAATSAERGNSWSGQRTDDIASVAARTVEFYRKAVIGTLGGASRGVCDTDS
jgi:glycosyltransferase involved in cell wall biosynthesis